MQYYGLLLHQYYKDTDTGALDIFKIYLYESKDVRDDFIAELSNFNEQGYNDNYNPNDYDDLICDIKAKASKDIFYNDATITYKGNIIIVNGYEVIKDEYFDEYEFAMWCE